MNVHSPGLTGVIDSRLPRARRRMSIRRLLKKHRYPPEEIPDALDTVMRQCELWVDYSEGE